MPLALDHYSKIRDNVVIIYYGFNPEYLLQLKLLFPTLKQKYPSLNFKLGSPDNLYYIISDLKESLPKSEIDINQFAYIKTIKDNRKQHPILNFLEEESIVCPTIIDKQNNNLDNKQCLICPDGPFEYESLSSKEADFCIKYAVRLGYKPMIVGSNICKYFNHPDLCAKNDEKIKLIQDSGWIIGTENELLYLAASYGIKTTLVPKSSGTDLYSKMFPDGGILKVSLM